MATPAVTATAGEKVVADAEELPKAIVRRLVKDKLSQLSQDGGDIQVLKDSLLAFSESSRIFIHYLSATANDICKESKRQTINAEDVFKALEEIEFPELVVSLRASLEGRTLLRLNYMRALSLLYDSYKLYFSQLFYGKS